MNEWGMNTHIVIARFLGSSWLARLLCLWWRKGASGYLLRLRGLRQQTHKVRQILLRRDGAALAGQAGIALGLLRGLKAEGGKPDLSHALQAAHKLQL